MRIQVLDSLGEVLFDSNLYAYDKVRFHVEGESIGFGNEITISAGQNNNQSQLMVSGQSPLVIKPHVSNVIILENGK